MESHPVLYSYRRCPYAMRARMGIYLAGLQVEQREIVFWDKPDSMLEASPKATVPVLILPNGQVVDESFDIMIWALKQAPLEQVGSETYSGLLPTDSTAYSKMMDWVDWNDGEFKGWLDKYKYADRFPEYAQSVYRQKGEPFLQAIELALSKQIYLLGEQLTAADIAVFPFVRQFVNVDKAWFQQTGYPRLKAWLNGLLESPVFMEVMKNRPVWQRGHWPLWISEPDLKTRDQFSAKAFNV